MRRAFPPILELCDLIPCVPGCWSTMDDSEPQMDVYSGVRWSVVAKYGAQLVEVCASVFVARLVAPEAYGLVGMAIVITGFLQVFQSLGLGSALVQRKQISESLLSSLFFISLGIGVVTTAVLVCGAPLASWIYGDARVGPVVAVLGMSFLVSAPALVPSALLTRQLAFRQLAWIDIGVAALRSVVVLVLAFAGWHVWALVWSSIIGVAGRTVLSFLYTDWRPRWLFSRGEVRGVFGFGANLTGFSIVNYFARNADNFLIGTFLGATSLGHYSLAYRILMFPCEAITNTLGRVTFPAFSRMQDDDARLKAAYLRVCGVIALVTFPLMTGMAAVARPFVEVVLGPSWLPAVPLIWVLAPLGAVQSIGVTAGQLFLAKGRADWMFRWGVVAGTLYIGSFLVGLPWGMLGIAVSYSVTSLVLMTLGCHIAFKLVSGLRVRDLGETLLPYGISAAVMGILVAVCRVWASHIIGMREAIALPCCVLAGVISYTVMMLIARPPALYNLGRLFPPRWFALARTRTQRIGDTV